MASLVELTSKKHSHLKVNPLHTIAVADKQHIINLKVTEISQALSSFPVFLSRTMESGEWSISAMVGLELGMNLFVKEQNWDALYEPSGMRTYPFFLMNSAKESGVFTVGIREDSEAFTEDGEDIFDDKGKPSLRLSNATAQLEADLKNELKSYQFCKDMEEYGLIKSIDIQVHYEDSRVNALQGLCTIDEEILASLDDEKFTELRTKGYLIPIYGLLMSMYQLNALIRRHNELADTAKVTQITMGTPKEA